MRRRAAILDDRGAPAPRGVLRAGWLILGLFFVLLGVIGAVVPLMPTTIFLILAAGCFARSSPRLEAKLLAHPRFGPTLQAWRAERAIPRRGKIGACVGMTIGLALFVWGAHPGPTALVVAALALLLCAAWIVTRPAPRQGAGAPAQ